MKKSILFIFALILGISTYAQESFWCMTDQKIQEYKESLSAEEFEHYLQEQETYEQEIQEYMRNYLEENKGNEDVHNKAFDFTIPVVVHIIHENDESNISNEQVENAIHWLNRYFQKNNSNWNTVVSDFLPIVADVNIEFKLAKRDNNGNCTSGITRTYSTQTGNANANRSSIVQNAQGNWPGNKYLNIFVAKNVGQNVAGYTMTPNANTGMSNGIHVAHAYMGTIGTGNTQGDNVLAHEVGHWLNLKHTWGDGNDPGSVSCNTDDGVMDTPLTKGSVQNCNFYANTCNDATSGLSSWTTDIVDNVENLMDYSSCPKMFTEGQKARMHAALNSNTGGRKNVCSPANLTATGVFDADVLCKADFMASKTVVCPGTTINFSDLSYNTVSGWNWEFQGGSPATSTSQNPSITYNTPGTYTVKLVASDGASSVTETKTAYIQVLSIGETLPYSEGFENASTLGDWDIINPDNNQKFVVTSSAAYSGTKSMLLQNNAAQNGSLDDLVSPSFDLSGVNPNEQVKLSFKYSYRKRASSNTDRLYVLVSNDCGENWVPRQIIKASVMSDNQIATSNWIPSSQNDWKSEVFTSFTSADYISNLRVMFRFESGGGNNFYIDDINLTIEGTSGVEQNNTAIKKFNLYPNPTRGITNVEFSLAETKDARIELTNMVGQVILSSTISAKQGLNKSQINTENIEAGIYLVKITAGENQETKRLIIQ